MMAGVADAGQVSAPIGTPVVLNNSGLGDTGNVTQAGLTSSTVAPPTNTTLFALYRSRASGARTHNAPTVTSLTNVSAWTLCGEIEESKSDASIFIHTSIWRAKVTGAASTGTVRATNSGTSFQQQLEIISIPNGGNVIRAASNSTDEHDATAGIVATFPTTPATGNIVLAATTVNSSATGNRTPDQVELTDAHISTLGWETQYDPAPAAASIGCGGIVANSSIVRSILAIEIASLG